MASSPARKRAKKDPADEIIDARTSVITLSFESVPASNSAGDASGAVPIGALSIRLDSDLVPWAVQNFLARLHQEGGGYLGGSVQRSATGHLRCVANAFEQPGGPRRPNFWEIPRSWENVHFQHNRRGLLTWVGGEMDQDQTGTFLILLESDTSLDEGNLAFGSIDLYDSANRKTIGKVEECARDDLLQVRIADFSLHSVRFKDLLDCNKGSHIHWDAVRSLLQQAKHHPLYRHAIRWKFGYGRSQNHVFHGQARNVLHRLIFHSAPVEMILETIPLLSDTDFLAWDCYETSIRNNQFYPLVSALYSREHVVFEKILAIMESLFESNSDAVTKAYAALCHYSHVDLLSTDQLLVIIKRLNDKDPLLELLENSIQNWVLNDGSDITCYVDRHNGERVESVQGLTAIWEKMCLLLYFIEYGTIDRYIDDGNGHDNDGDYTYSSSVDPKEKEDLFSIFVQVLLKYLEKEDPKIYGKAKETMKHCAERNEAGDSKYTNLGVSMRKALRKKVGKKHWTTAETHLEHYLHLKKKNSAAEAKVKAKIASGNLPPPPKDKFSPLCTLYALGQRKSSGVDDVRLLPTGSIDNFGEDYDDFPSHILLVTKFVGSNQPALLVRPGGSGGIPLHYAATAYLRYEEGYEDFLSEFDGKTPFSGYHLSAGDENFSYLLGSSADMLCSKDKSGKTVLSCLLDHRARKPVKRIQIALLACPELVLIPNRNNVLPIYDALQPEKFFYERIEELCYIVICFATAHLSLNVPIDTSFEEVASRLLDCLLELEPYDVFENDGQVFVVINTVSKVLSATKQRKDDCSHSLLEDILTRCNDVTSYDHDDYYQFHSSDEQFDFASSSIETILDMLVPVPEAHCCDAKHPALVFLAKKGHRKHREGSLRNTEASFFRVVLKIYLKIRPLDCGVAHDGEMPIVSFIRCAVAFYSGISSDGWNHLLRDLNANSFDQVHSELIGEINEFLSLFLAGNPRALSECNDSGSTLLFEVCRLGLSLQVGEEFSIIKHIASLSPKLMTQRDRQTNMLPFQAAAASPSASVEDIYFLLRHDPGSSMNGFSNL